MSFFLDSVKKKNVCLWEIKSDCYNDDASGESMRMRNWNAYLTIQKLQGVKLHGGDKADLTVNMKCTQNDRIVY